MILALLFLAGQPITFQEHLRLGQDYLDRNEAGRAATEFETAVHLKPDSAAAQYHLGVALRLWGDAEGSERALRESLRLQPQFPEAYFVLGLVLGDRVGSESTGLAAFENAVRQKPDFADAHFNIGIIHWKNGEFSAALPSFRKAAEGRPGCSECRFRLGQTLARMGNTVEAILELEAAAKLDAANEASRVALAQLCRKLGDDAKAAEWADAARQIRSQAATGDRDRGGLEFRQGKTALDENRLDVAFRHFTDSLKTPFDEVRVL